jgi:dUTP pyrophosphatase
MKVKFKKLTPGAVTPMKATDGSACFDLYVATDAEARTVFKGAPGVLHTGLAVEVPAGHVMLVFSRSGHGFRDGIRLVNCVGVIDSDYRGELLVKLTSDMHTNSFLPGDRIAQAMILPVPEVTWEETHQLAATVRGDGGLGSTGA